MKYYFWQFMMLGYRNFDVTSSLLSSYFENAVKQYCIYC